MTQPYREAEPVNLTEIEIAKNREAEETKRHEATLRARGRTERREVIAKWLSYDSTGGAFVLFVLCVLGTGVTISIMGAYAHWFIK